MGDALMKKVLALLLVLSLLLAGCAEKDTPQAGGTQPDEPLKTIGPSSGTADTAEPSSVLDTSKLFTDRDYQTGYNNGIDIVFSGSIVTCSGSGVTVNGSTVTITAEGTYILSGTLDNGMVIVDTDKQTKVQLVCSGVSIHSDTSAPLYIRQADKVFLTLAEGTENSLSNGGSFKAIDENSIDSVIFSKEDLTINGSGSLNVTSPAGHGIVSKDELTITGGQITVQSASHGITGKDNVCIDGAAVSIFSGKDGIQADIDEDESLGFVYIANGSFTIEAAGDGISTSSQLQINGGSFDIVTGGGSVNGEAHTSENWGNMGGGRPGGMGGGRPGGMGGNRPGSMGGGSKGSSPDTVTEEDSTSIKGIKSASGLVINNGTFRIDSADDAIHSNANITVNGGSFTIATGDDGFHADAALTINAGTVSITESYEGLEGLSILLAGGDITLVASDDGLNAAGGNDESGFGGFRGGDMFAASPDSYIIISGGTLFVNASGDGIDSNGDLTVTGGNTVVEGPTDGANGPLDYGGSASISGGTLAVTGSMQMAQSVKSDGQGVLAFSVGNQAGRTAWEIRDSQGNVLISGQPQKAYSCIVASCPEMVSGQTYTVTVGTLSGKLEAS